VNLNSEGKKTATKETLRYADKSLGRPGRKHATKTEDFEFHIFYLKS